jgi:tripartite-type tricarboxylate transporter receptor subunit TctC
LFLSSVISIWTFGSSTLANTQGKPFYQGKTIRILVGSTSGSLYDHWANLLARALSKHIPGQPSMIVQNMRGASGIVAANYGYTVAAPDGLTLVMFHRHVYMEQLIERKEVWFDLRRYQWIGSPDKSRPMLYIRADSPYKTIEDIVKSPNPPKCGATGTSDLTYSMSKVLEVALGGSVNLVVGYTAGSKIDLAMEGGEVVCRVTSLDVHLNREPYQTWDKTTFDRHLLFFGHTRDPRIPKLPTIYELMEQKRTPKLNRQVAEVILGGNGFGRPVVAPPGTPAKAIKILRAAYLKVLSDPEFLSEVKRLKISIDPSTGEELQDLVRKVMDQPPEVIARLKTLLAD